MSLQASQTPNNKRYWGEEKNIDSIYTIYLKKISYTYNNDISLSASYASQQQNKSLDGLNETTQDDSISTNSTSAAANQLARVAIENSRNLNSNNICHKQEDSPRGRRNFFQKYRRRSCSVDKYTFEKNQQLKNNNLTPTTNKVASSKTMRYTSSEKKSSSRALEALGVSQDDLDGPKATVKSATSKKNGLTNGQNCHKQQVDDMNKSVSELSSQSSQSLQWETRQIKVLQAATLDHALKFILLINSGRDLNNKLDSDSDPALGDSALEEERNNVAHIIHVIFCTYRIYTNPYELMLKLMDYSDICRIEQYRFVMHYWMDNYPEDFDYIVESAESLSQKDNSSSNINTAPSMTSYNNSITSNESSTTTKTAATSDSDNSIGRAGSTRSGSEILARRLSSLSLKTSDDKPGLPLISELLRLCKDEYIRNKALKLNDIRNCRQLESEAARRSRYNQTGTKNSAVLDFDSRYVAQQLTAIDLENFLSLRPYALLEGTKSDKRIQSMIKNFNLLSRHVVVTILKSHSPVIVTSHWIAIAMNLRKMKNFNSLKAIIAGLTNESIYRLKQMIWSKIDRNSLNNFKLMASIVDDINNQTVLRQTQLIVEGTAKMSIEDDSFGTIPYLGTFLTDLNMIDARYQSHVLSPKDETSKLKLINFEKCAKQFEILTQLQLLQKNVSASLHAIQRRNHFDEQTTLNRLKLEFSQNQQILLAKPAIPQVSRLFENWFYDNSVATMTDKQW